MASRTWVAARQVSSTSYGSYLTWLWVPKKSSPDVSPPSRKLPLARLVDLRPLPRQSSIPSHPGGHEDARPERTLIEELHALCPKRVEPIRQHVGRPTLRKTPPIYVFRVSLLGVGHLATPTEHAQALPLT